MSQKNTYLIIMAGGVGSRFWPLSKRDFPKQFHDFMGTGKSLLRATYERHLSICNPENIYIVTNHKYIDLVKEQIPELDNQQILSEPSVKNTAPCIAYATYKIYKNNPSAQCIVCPSDHLILNESEYIKTLHQGLKNILKDDVLLTIGIRPTRPDTGYGYIQFAEDKKSIKKVKTFTEKPDLELAKQFIESGDYFWNAGIFIWSAKSIIKAFSEQMPELHEIFNDMIFHYYTDGELKAIKDAYSKCKSTSIDVGVMEKTDNVYTILSDFGWSDLGTWNSIYNTRDKDENGNVIEANTLLKNVSDSIIFGKKDKLIVAQNLDGYIIVDDTKALLICKRQDEQKVREIVTEIKTNKGQEYL